MSVRRYPLLNIGLLQISRSDLTCIHWTGPVPDWCTRFVHLVQGPSQRRQYGSWPPFVFLQINFQEQNQLNKITFQIWYYRETKPLHQVPIVLLHRATEIVKNYFIDQKVLILTNQIPNESDIKVIGR